MQSEKGSSIRQPRREQLLSPVYERLKWPEEGDRNRGDLECDRVGVGRQPGEATTYRGGVPLNCGKPLLIGT